MQETHNIKITT